MKEGNELNDKEPLCFEEYTLIETLLAEPWNPPSARELMNPTMADDMAERGLVLKQEVQGLPFYMASPFGVIMAGRYRAVMKRARNGRN
jgi:hypothetical protein